MSKLTSPLFLLNQLLPDGLPHYGSGVTHPQFLADVLHVAMHRLKTQV